jgi:hypothetical protein
VRTQHEEEVEMGVVSLIVMEPGSQWPGHVRDSENIVAASHLGEGLLQRTRRTLAGLLQRDQHVRVAVLACSEATDVASLACRAQLARELLDAVAATGFGRLVLCSADHASLSLRRELLSLAGALSQTVLGTTVRVRFDDAPGDLRRASH